MKNFSHLFKDINNLQKITLTLLLFLPLALTTSIFIADLFASIIAIITISWIINDKSLSGPLKFLKKPIFIIFSFYLIIILSLIFSTNLSKSFLPSFFYFRYFLLSLGFFILIYNFNFTLKLTLISLLLLLILISLDSIIEFLKIKKIFGLTLPDSRVNTGTAYFLTSFFDDEKKLGSFLIRILPLILSLLILLDFKILKKIDSKLLVIILVGILIFLSSERVAFFLFLFFFIFSLKVLNNRLTILLFVIFSLTFLSFAQPRIYAKYVYATLAQFNLIDFYYVYDKEGNFKSIIDNLDFSNVYYISEEHQKLAKSGIEIFKENPITGSGIKTYHRYCKNLKEKKSLDIKCSSHPHNTYIQIASDIGIFGLIIISIIFLYILLLNIKILFTKNLSTIKKSFYILNLGIIINLMPFIPSGSFFNNWMNLMFYFPLGLWLYLYYQLNSQNKINENI